MQQKTTGQLPQRRHVHRLIEDALLGGAVAEEGDRDMRQPAVAIGHAGPHHMGNAAADDGIGAEMAQPHVGDVHRAALAGAIAVGLAGDLRHHALGIGTAGDEDAVAAVMGGEAVALLHRLADAGHRFLADRHVQHRARRLRRARTVR